MTDTNITYMSDDEEAEVEEYFAHKPKYKPENGVWGVADAATRARGTKRFEELISIADDYDGDPVDDIRVEVEEVPDGLSFRVFFRHRGIDCSYDFYHPGVDSCNQQGGADSPGSASGTASDAHADIDAYTV